MRPRRIALLLGQDIGYCRKVLSGILSYVPQDSRWIHRDSSPDVRIIPFLRKWTPDGIIAHIFDPEIAEALRQFGCPIVNTTDTLPDSNIPRVETNNLAVGKMAARYFLSKGFSNFGYVGSSSANFSIDRETGFRGELEQRGFSVSTCHAQYLPRPSLERIWGEDDGEILQWLKSLPKPCAILASNDIPARRITELCDEANINVPSQIAVLGVDNDEAECQMSNPPLSSIETPTKDIGYNAARTLDALINREPLGRIHLQLEPLRVISRASTDTRKHADPIINRIINVISEHAGKNPSVDDVARYCSCSRRLIEKKVSIHLKTTVLRMVQEEQIKLAKSLLLESNLSVSEIAERSGFGSQRRLNDVFKKLTRSTPSRFRHNRLG